MTFHDSLPDALNEHQHQIDEGRAPMFVLSFCPLSGTWTLNDLKIPADIADLYYAPARIPLGICTPAFTHHARSFTHTERLVRHLLLAIADRPPDNKILELLVESTRCDDKPLTPEEADELSRLTLSLRQDDGDAVQPSQPHPTPDRQEQAG